MRLSSIDDEDIEDTPSRLPSTGTSDEAKAATEKFLLDAKSKADAHFSESRQLRGSLEGVFQDLSEVSGLCAWHSRKLTRLLLLVRSNACDLGMIQALEEPLTDFFSGGFGDGFLVSVNDYKFYADIKLEECTVDGGIDRDLLRWAGHNLQKTDSTRSSNNAAMHSYRPGSAVVETLQAVKERLEEWKRCIRSIGNNENTLQKTKVRIFKFFGNDKTPNVDDQSKTLLGASPQEFETLLDGMSALIHQIMMELPADMDVTSRRHEHALTVILDDIRLQIKQANGAGLPIMERSNSTPYQRAQALEVRVKNWVRHELEFCEFRDEIQRQLMNGSWRRPVRTGDRRVSIEI